MTDMKAIHIPISPMAEFYFEPLDKISDIKSRILSNVNTWIPYSNQADTGEAGWFGPNAVPVYDQELFAWFEICINKFTDQYLPGVELKFVDSWISRCQFGQEGGFHVHINSMVSGVFYFDDHIAEIEFKYTNNIWQHWESLTMGQNFRERQQHFTVPCNKGKLILFDSRLTHRVMRNLSLGKPRYSLAFNLFPSKIQPIISAALVYDIKDVRSRYQEYLDSQS